MQADSGKRLHHDLAGSSPMPGVQTRHPVAGTSKLLVYQPIFTTQTVVVFDLERLEERHRLPEMEAMVTALGVSADSSTVVLADRDGNLLAWDPAEGTELGRHEVDGRPTQVVVDAQGKRAALLVEGQVRVVDLER